MPSKKVKVEVSTVNISSTFLMRCVCKECGSGPYIHYAIRKPLVWDEPKQLLSASKWLRRYVQRMVQDWYLDAEPKYFHSLRELTFSLTDKHFVPSHFRTKGFPSDPRNNVVDIMQCECSATVWWYSQQAIKDKPEVVNRKGKYCYPKKFEW